MADIEKKHQEAREKFFKQLTISLSHMQWDEELLEVVNRECNFLLKYYLILFPNGEKQIAEEFELWQDHKMLELLTHEEPQFKIREKIQRALEIRIMEIVPKSVILKQKAFFLLPSNLLAGANCYARTCDLIWRYAGDKSDDFNFYSKRGLLLGVYTMAQLFYLSDDSQGYIKTQEFIATCLQNVINIANIRNKIILPSLEDIPILRLFS